MPSQQFKLEKLTIEETLVEEVLTVLAKTIGFTRDVSHVAKTKTETVPDLDLSFPTDSRNAYLGNELQEAMRKVKKRGIGETTVSIEFKIKKKGKKDFEQTCMEQWIIPLNVLPSFRADKAEFLRHCASVRRQVEEALRKVIEPTKDDMILPPPVWIGGPTCSVTISILEAEKPSGPKSFFGRLLRMN